MEYMAPEQITRDDLDGRTDLYTLGLVLYELLTGDRPYRAHTARGYIEQHLKAHVRPPIEVNSSVPEHLNAICLRLLEKQPSDRYASAHHLLQMLGEHSSPDSLDVERWPPRAVGRVAHKATLEHLIDQLHHHAAGHALLIKGTTGQGKTSLLDTGVEIAKTHGIAVARGRAPGRRHLLPVRASLPNTPRARRGRSVGRGLRQGRAAGRSIRLLRSLS